MPPSQPSLKLAARCISAWRYPHEESGPRSMPKFPPSNLTADRPQLGSRQNSGGAQIGLGNASGRHRPASFADTAKQVRCKHSATKRPPRPMLSLAYIYCWTAQDFKAGLRGAVLPQFTSATIEKFANCAWRVEAVIPWTIQATPSGDPPRTGPLGVLSDPASRNSCSWPGWGTSEAARSQSKRAGTLASATQHLEHCLQTLPLSIPQPRLSGESWSTSE